VGGWEVGGGNKRGGGGGEVGGQEHVLYES
jgi:hypothetical protein